MNDIVEIIDLDGYTINKKFLCRELATIGVGQDTGTSYHFNIGVHWKDLTLKDRKSCMYVYQHVHKLPLNAHRGSLPLGNLDGIVKDFYTSVKEKEESTLAYKGGCLERNLLKKLNILACNLEWYGCPKAEQLFSKLPWLETCGKHIGTDPYKHCPKVEVEGFMLWLKEHKGI